MISDYKFYRTIQNADVDGIRSRLDEWLQKRSLLTSKVDATVSWFMQQRDNIVNSDYYQKPQRANVSEWSYYRPESNTNYARELHEMRGLRSECRAIYELIITDKSQLSDAITMTDKEIKEGVVEEENAAIALSDAQGERIETMNILNSAFHVDMSVVQRAIKTTTMHKMINTVVNRLEQDLRAIQEDLSVKRKYLSDCISRLSQSQELSHQYETLCKKMETCEQIVDAIFEGNTVVYH